ncbi:unnamed protein product [Heligmosomoides polygyrus]|uniref:Reverse transcriptase domain-containing protein n=1 Tax=Heligmosomoides polygyrus TaxID=6339 RepID=A0A183G452_HELPZ|nr:unnamed protein product [Heligmosomoides polygyrus]
MKPGKATGPDDLAVDVWKSKLWYPAEWLAEFFNQRILEGEFVKSSSSPTNSAALCLVAGLLTLHAARLLVEKHHEKKKPAHVAFLDLEAFNRVPRKVTWYVLRQHNVPEELIEWMRMLYSCP